MAQKYACSTQITPENVGQLEKVWELHTGDVSDGKGDIPGTVWSATPIVANDTVYIGTPFIACSRRAGYRQGQMEL